MQDVEKILDPRFDSYSMTFNCLRQFEEIIATFAKKTFTCDALFEELHTLTRFAIKREPNKVLIRRTLNYLLNHCKRILKSDRDKNEILETLREKINHTREELEVSAQKIAGMASRAIAQTNKIMTLGNDYLVRSTLIEAEKQKRRFEVFVVKNEPLREGLELAEFLAAQGIRTTVIDDAQIGSFLPQINLVLVGGDRLFERGFVHRSGTLPLCLTAKHFSIPVYLLADTKAILLEKERSIKFHEQDAEQIYRPQNENIQVHNIYHEVVPYHLVYKVVCEDGIFEMKEFINWYLAE
jgi:translation initiation factor 2B subunit (eIF-2B alpha/beta/delta family)